MPGVPSFRGCDACHKQKKKCDQAKPACARCARLRIPCVGSGEQRYKFMHQTGTLALRQHRHAVDIPSNPPTSESARVAAAFSAALEVTDIGFDLTIYGDFFRDIPRRIGTGNEAFDACAQSFVTLLPWVRTHQLSADMFEKYSHALGTLRLCMGDPVKAYSAETLCATYLVVICEGWVARWGDSVASHTEAMSHLLNVAAAKDWRGDFETDMMASLSFLVMMESFGNPRIQLDPQLWAPRSEAPAGPRSPAADLAHIESLELRSLSKAAALIRHLRSGGLVQYLPEIQSAYREARNDCAKVKQILLRISLAAADGALAASQVIPTQKVHVRYQGAYSILLSMAIMFNAILCVCEPLNSILAEESVAFVDESIAVAEQGLQYRPLGSSSMPACLVAAWAVADDARKRAQVENILEKYQQDFPSANWMEAARLLEAQRRSLWFGTSVSG